MDTIGRTNLTWGDPDNSAKYMMFKLTSTNGLYEIHATCNHKCDKLLYEWFLDTPLNHGIDKRSCVRVESLATCKTDANNDFNKLVKFVKLLGE